MHGFSCFARDGVIFAHSEITCGQCSITSQDESGTADKSSWEYLMSSGSKNVLEQLRNNYDWASQVLNGDLLFSKEMDSYKLAAFYLFLMECKASMMLLKDMLDLEVALMYNVNTEMIFDRMLMTGVKVT